MAGMGLELTLPPQMDLATGRGLSQTHGGKSHIVEAAFNPIAKIREESPLENGFLQDFGPGPSGASVRRGPEGDGEVRTAASCPAGEHFQEFPPHQKLSLCLNGAHTWPGSHGATQLSGLRPGTQPSTVVLPKLNEFCMEKSNQPTRQKPKSSCGLLLSQRPSTRSLFLCCSYQSLLQKVSFKQTCSLPHSCCHVEGGFSCWEKQRSWGHQSIPQNARGLGWLRREQAGFTSFVGLPSCTHAFCFQVSKSLQNSGPGCKFISVLCSARKHPPQPPLPSHPSWKQPPAELSMLWGEQSWVPRQYFGSPPSSDSSATARGLRRHTEALCWPWLGSGTKAEAAAQARGP